MIKQKVVVLSTVGALVFSSGAGVFAEETKLENQLADSSLVEEKRLGNDLGQYNPKLESAIQDTETVSVVNDHHQDSSISDGASGTGDLLLGGNVDLPDVPVENPDSGGTIIGSDGSTVAPPSDGEGVVVSPNDKPTLPSETPIEPTLPTTTTEEKTVAEQPKPVEPATTKEAEPAITNPVEKPVVITSGTIIGTQDGNVLLQNQDGTVQTLSVSAVGGTLESDGTIKIKDSSGKMTRLPNTGQHTLSSVALTLIGILTLFGTVYLKFKEFLG